MTASERLRRALVMQEIAARLVIHERRLPSYRDSDAVCRLFLNQHLDLLGNAVDEVVSAQAAVLAEQREGVKAADAQVAR